MRLGWSPWAKGAAQVEPRPDLASAAAKGSVASHVGRRNVFLDGRGGDWELSVGVLPKGPGPTPEALGALHRELEDAGLSRERFPALELIERFAKL